MDLLKELDYVESIIDSISLEWEDRPIENPIIIEKLTSIGDRLKIAAAGIADLEDQARNTNYGSLVTKDTEIDHLKEYYNQTRGI